MGAVVMKALLLETTGTLRDLRGASVGIGALALGLLAPSEAWAQCTDNFNVIVPVGIGFAAASTFPIASSVNAFISTINTMNTAFLTTTSAFVSAPANPRPDQPGGGVWARTVAGSTDSDTSSTGNLDISKTALPFQITGTQKCNTSITQDYWGYQAGADFSILNHAGTGENWHWGVTGGSLQAWSRDTTPGGTFVNPNFPGVPLTTLPGDLKVSTEVPYVGVYTAYTKGNFFADAQLRFDFYQNAISEVLSGLSGRGLDAHGVSTTYNAGYHVPLQSGWFVEPSAGFVWSRVSIDSLSLAVPGVLPVPVKGIVTFGDIESDLGRGSFTIGNTFTHAGVTWQPYFTASVFHEFDGNATATGLLAGNSNPLIDGATATSHTTGGVGTYGQYALGTVAVLGNSGWLGYVRGDYRKGDDIEGWGITGGLRYQLNPVSAPLK